ncbi:MAG: lipoprotein [Proteobacteria bacterium]|uniref:LPS translocon maturation chaperone LptM n=1 Tax=Rudaea sp. TaxID=2136325 RepID=UPI001DF506B5|nr:lipoprotein [Pseudomonadota bacterium]MBS0568488.1 lipoprotein [Pseudomonadota bacterium]
MSHALRLTSLVLAAALALSACGNKGPLVLPDKTPEQQQGKDKQKDQPASAPAPAARSGDAAGRR